MDEEVIRDEQVLQLIEEAKTADYQRAKEIYAIAVKLLTGVIEAEQMLDYSVEVYRTARAKRRQRWRWPTGIPGEEQDTLVAARAKIAERRKKVETLISVITSRYPNIPVEEYSRKKN